MQMARYLCVEQDPEGFRRSLVEAGFLQPGGTAEHRDDRRSSGVFYDTIREPGPRTITERLRVRRGTPLLRPAQSGVAAHAWYRGTYVILQRINLGLFGDARPAVRNR